LGDRPTVVPREDTLFVALGAEPRHATAFHHDLLGDDDLKSLFSLHG
jgi:hypothetical protein